MKRLLKEACEFYDAVGPFFLLMLLCFSVCVGAFVTLLLLFVR
jgi:hypothetical protein